MQAFMDKRKADSDRNFVIALPLSTEMPPMAQKGRCERCSNSACRGLRLCDERPFPLLLCRSHPQAPVSATAAPAAAAPPAAPPPRGRGSAHLMPPRHHARGSTHKHLVEDNGFYDKVTLMAHRARGRESRANQAHIHTERVIF
eukprot:6195865-Pleurochrysis_carterae.AAC.2